MSNEPSFGMVCSLPEPEDLSEVDYGIHHGAKLKIDIHGGRFVFILSAPG